MGTRRFGVILGIGAALVWHARLHAMVIDPVDPTFGPAQSPGIQGRPASLQRIAMSPQGKAAALVLRPDAPGCLTPTLDAFLPDGHPDPGFGTGGRATAEDLGLPCVAAAGAGIAANGDAGWIVTATPLAVPAAPRVWKIRPDGHVDTAFGVAGSVPVPGVAQLARPTLQVLGNGRIAVGGTLGLTNSAGQVYAALGVVMLLADGSADAAYGEQGVAVAVPANRPIWQGEGGGMVIAEDGSALVAGQHLRRRRRCQALSRRHGRTLRCTRPPRPCLRRRRLRDSAARLVNLRAVAGSAQRRGLCRGLPESRCPARVRPAHQDQRADRSSLR